MKKVFEYAVYAASAISWLSLLVIFAVDDIKSEISFERIIILVAGLIIFWALSQLALAYVLSNKNNCPDKRQSEEQAKLDARKKEQESMEQAYHIALICKTDKLIDLTRK